MALGHGRTGRRVPDRTLRNQFLSLNRHSRPAHCRRNYRIGDRTYLCAISDGLLLALLHRCLDRNRGPMNVWDWEPSVIFGCSALAIGYIVLVRKHGFHRAPYFLAGVILLLFDLVSPIDTLADRYLFSAHIVQHFLLALVIPPLLLLGTPRFELGSLSKFETRNRTAAGFLAARRGYDAGLAHSRALQRRARERRPAHFPAPEFPHHRYDFLV